MGWVLSGALKIASGHGSPAKHLLKHSYARLGATYLFGGRARDFPNEISSQGKFHVPAKYPPHQKGEYFRRQILVSGGDL